SGLAVAKSLDGEVIGRDGRARREIREAGDVARQAAEDSRRPPPPPPRRQVFEEDLAPKPALWEPLPAMGETWQAFFAQEKSPAVRVQMPPGATEESEQRLKEERRQQEERRRQEERQREEERERERSKQRDQE
ncbi:unnamed protein product, partial [Polarella glacialis]